MSIVGFKCVATDENVSFENCIKCALTCENKCHLTADILTGIVENVTEERSTISITKMIGCMRSTYLSTKYDTYASPEKLYWAFRGTLAHAVIEKYNADKEAILETKFARTVNGIKITGTPDIIIPTKELIRDYKTTKQVPYYSRPYPNHEVQLNLYRWLVRPKYKIERLEIVYMDMMKTKIIPVKKLWKLSDCEDYVAKHSAILAKAQKDDIPPPVPAEFPLYWQCNDFCEGKAKCAEFYQEELRKDYDKWCAEEWSKC